VWELRARCTYEHVTYFQTSSAHITQKVCHGELHCSTVTHFPNYAYTPHHMKCIDVHLTLLVTQLILNHRYIHCTRFMIQLIASFLICKCSLSQEIVRYRCCIQIQLKLSSVLIVVGCGLRFTHTLHLCALTACNCKYTLGSVRGVWYQLSDPEIWYKGKTPRCTNWANFLCQNCAKLSKFCTQYKEPMVSLRRRRLQAFR